LGSIVVNGYAPTFADVRQAAFRKVLFPDDGFPTIPTNKAGNPHSLIITTTNKSQRLLHLVYREIAYGTMADSLRIV
jgi:hypothetical protein